MNLSLSVVTPTYHRPQEAAELLDNLSQQTAKPQEIIIIDCAPDSERDTEIAIKARAKNLSYKCRYLRHARGTAIQRNAGIEAATGDLIAFIDDDVRLEPEFFQHIHEVFLNDKHEKIGGVVGYRTNAYFKLEDRSRWVWYRRLGLLTTFEPGHYDYKTGYPINANMQPPFDGIRDVDFMTTACAVWRRKVFTDGLRFDRFFTDYGVLEDAHFALRARKKWRLVQCGDAKCRELSSPKGRTARNTIGYKVVVNYYFVFSNICRPLSRLQKMRFWRYQCFEIIRIFWSGIIRRRLGNFAETWGRLRGFIDIFLGRRDLRETKD